ncbi:unnamed protein product [Onchocerca flexuosa]|uniref:Breast cancer type 2 susceptibility protein homolog n=1 Tax=Onchocerca flexuosa TaxID=387005 RepID=A0A183H0U9_9BILA|nr:unnamed protein product [Onchocerca flexuosa]
MSEDGKNITDISDEMSSLIHAAEEWANEQLIGTHSNDLNDSNSYPMYMPIEEVAREVALKLCKIYDLDPETRTDNRLPKRNAGDTISIHQSSEVSTLHSIPQDVAFLSSTMKLDGCNSTETSKILSSTKHAQNHQQKAFLDTFQPSTTTYEDIVNKTFIVESDTSLNIPKELDIFDQITHGNNTMNKTYAVRSTSFNMRKKLDINKTFVVRRNASLNMPEKLITPDETIQDNLKQQSIAPEKVTLPITDTTYSFVKDNSYKNKFSDVQNPEKNTCVSSNDNCSNILNKKKMPKAKEYSENAEQKFLPSTFENSFVNPVLDTILSSITTDYQEFPDNDLDINIPRVKCSKETQKIPKMFTTANPESEDIKFAHKGINIANSNCSTARNTIIDIKDKVTILPSNEAITEKCMLTANNIIRPSFLKTNKIIRPSFSKTNKIIRPSFPRTNKIIRPSFPKTNKIIRPSFPKTSEISRLSFPQISVNDANIRKTVNLPENKIPISRTVTEKEKNLSVIKSMQPNASQNNAFYRMYFKENRVLTVELDQKLRCLLIKESVT